MVDIYFDLLLFFALLTNFKAVGESDADGNEGGGKGQEAEARDGRISRRWKRKSDCTEAGIFWLPTSYKKKEFLRAWAATTDKIPPVFFLFLRSDTSLHEVVHQSLIAQFRLRELWLPSNRRSE